MVSNAASASVPALGSRWSAPLKEAAAQGTSRIRVKMAHAVSIAKLTNPARVDWALGHAAVHQRFGEGDLASILAANLDPATPAARQAGEGQYLTQGTEGWGHVEKIWELPSPRFVVTGRGDSERELTPSRGRRAGRRAAAHPAAPDAVESTDPRA